MHKILKDKANGMLNMNWKSCGVFRREASYDSEAVRIGIDGETVDAIMNHCVGIF